MGIGCLFAFPSLVSGKKEQPEKRCGGFIGPEQPNVRIPAMTGGREIFRTAGMDGRPLTSCSRRRPIPR